ncbi:MAG: hypothetical protein K2G26_00065 [Clostridia bacterium]|nr:hypothetical protein [Clostridia bacterium]
MDNFQTIKRKYLIIAIVAGVVLGVCCGVAVTCALAVVFKRCGVNFFWALYIPIALVLSAGFGGLFYLLLRPTDNKIAKKLDREYGLNQKAQTMVEFANAEGPMPALQREQANEVLGEVAKKRVNLNWLWKFAFIPVLALAMLFVGIFVPAKKAAQPVEPPYNMTEAQKTALANLIADVNASSLSTDLKTSTVEVLNGLMDGLEKEKTQSEMKKAVISAVKIIDTTVAAANSYIKLNKTLSAEESLSPLAEALSGGATFYVSGSTQITSFDGVKSKEKEADELISTILNGWTATFMEQFATKEDENSAPVPIAGEQASQKLSAFASALSTQLASSEYAPKGEEGEKIDPLYAALSAFANNQTELTQKYSNVSAAAYYGSINGTCTSFVTDCVKALVTQSYSCMMDEYVRNSLARIFGINRSEFGDSPAVVQPDNTQNDDPEKPNEGAPGNGDIQYGSDDLVLDVDTGELVPYGQLLNKYYLAVTEHINSGACGDEIAMYIRQYFNLLNSKMEESE